MIDWDKPIEAVRKSDGFVFPVTLWGRCFDGEGYRTNETPDPDTTNSEWYPDGRDWCHEDKWFVRNRPEVNTPTETLRDRFAMAVIQGLAANPATNSRSAEECVAKAWAVADAMMAARGDV